MAFGTHSPWRLESSSLKMKSQVLRREISFKLNEGIFAKCMVTNEFVPIHEHAMNKKFGGLQVIQGDSYFSSNLKKIA